MEGYQEQKRNGKNGNGIISTGGLIEVLKKPEEASLTRVVTGLMLKENHIPEIFALYNPEKGWFELPGGKIERTDNYPKRRLIKEFLQEVGVNVEIDEDFKARYKLNVRGIPRIFEVYFCKYNSLYLPSKPKENKFPYFEFIPMIDIMQEKRKDVSPLMYNLSRDLIPYIKEENINFEGLHKKLE